MSFVFFSVRMPDFDLHARGGDRGFFPFIFALPWLIIILGTVFIIFIEKLVRHYKIGYRRPIVFSLLVVVVVSLLGSFVIERSRFHDRFGEFAERRQMPIFHPLYRPHNKKFRMLHVVPGASTTLSLR